MVKVKVQIQKLWGWAFTTKALPSLTHNGQATANLVDVHVYPAWFCAWLRKREWALEWVFIFIFYLFIFLASVHYVLFYRVHWGKFFTHTPRGRPLAHLVARWAAEWRVERSILLWGNVSSQIHLISPGCPRPNSALTVHKSGLKHRSSIHSHTHPHTLSRYEDRAPVTLLKLSWIA